VTRIVATLITNHKVTLAGEKVGQFALTFITPLRTHYDGRWHENPHFLEWFTPEEV
jgi:hypothetical protein